MRWTGTLLALRSPRTPFLDSFRIADDSPRIVLIRGFTAWLLFFRDGSNDQFASAAPRQRPFSLRDGSSDKFLNLWTRQRRRGLDPDKTVLAPAAEEQVMRIGERGPVVERQPNSIRACGNGQDAIGRCQRKVEMSGFSPDRNVRVHGFLQG